TTNKMMISSRIPIPMTTSRIQRIQESLMIGQTGLN
ncbi:MAG: hypothetical protein RLY56_1665, partial [Pseudomonadota bacterium]